jgi:hypothetical protein
MESETHILVRFRTFIVFRHWISEHYLVDFAQSRPLRYLVIVTFVNDLCASPVIRASTRDYRLVKALKKLLKSQDAEFKSLRTQIAPEKDTPNSSSDPLYKLLHRSQVQSYWDTTYAPCLKSARASRHRDSGIARSFYGLTLSVGNGRDNSRTWAPYFSLEERSSATDAKPAATHDSISPLSNKSPSPLTPYSELPESFLALVNTKKSILFQFKSETLAQHFTILEEMLLLAIPWTDLLDHAARSSSSGLIRGTPIANMIERFNMVSGDLV